MYVRQLAYYQARPEGDKVSRMEKIRAKAEKEDEEGLDICLPECSAEYLVLLFYESGMYEVGMRGILPLSWQEFKSWLEVTERELSLWEITTLKDMSVAYCKEFSEASDRNAVAPYTEEVELTPERRKQINDELKRSIEAMMQTQREQK